jgi:hypothetical protein
LDVDDASPYIGKFSLLLNENDTKNINTVKPENVFSDIRKWIRWFFFHMNQLDDLLFSLPVLKSAKQELSARIYSVVKSALSPLLTSSGLVDGKYLKRKIL